MLLLSRANASVDLSAETFGSIIATAAWDAR